MADITELLWQQFGVETQEHLDALEAQLADASSNATDTEQIDSMFRAFHSLKGLAAAMGMTAMETLSHSAESAMSPARDGSAALTEPLVDLLVRALDVLREMQERAVRERADSPQSSALLAEFTGIGDGSGAAVSQPDADKADDATADATPVVDERLSAFADLVLPTMTALVEAMASSSPDAMRELDDDLIKLDGLAGELGLQGFRRRVRALSRAVHRDGPDIALLRDTAVSLATLEEMTGRDAGRTVLFDMVSRRGAGDAGRMCVRAASLLSGEIRDEDDPDTAAKAFEFVANQTELLNLPRSGRLAWLCADVLRRGTLSDDLKVLMIDVADGIAAALATDPPDDLDEDRSKHLVAELRRAAGNLVDPVLADRLDALAVDVDLVGLLPLEAAQVLEAAVNNPKTQLVELDADLETDAAFAEKFAAWIAENCDVVGSRTIDVEGRHQTRLLVSTELDGDTFLASLTSIDTALDLIDVHICDGREREKSQPQAADARPGDQVVRVTGQALDSFMTRVGDLIRIQSGIEHLTRDARLTEAVGGALFRMREAGVDDGDLAGLFEHWSDRLTLMSEDLERTLKLLQADVMDLRVVPVDTLLQRFPRIARDLARRHDKDVKVIVEGRNARIDKGMVDVLADPLTHMIRNAIDHGIEMPEQRRAVGKSAQATVNLSAEQQGDRVLIELADDGRGIDLERVRHRIVEAGMASETALAEMADEDVCRFIFSPGFSTAEKVTETSGRGVGMDVVDRVVTRLGGSIRIATVPGQGTRFIMDLPLSAAIQSTLIVEQSQQIFAIPERFVDEVVGHEKLDERLRGAGGVHVPVVGLGDLLRFPNSQAVNGQQRVVVLALGRRRLGLTVDRVVNRRDIYVKESHPGIASIPGIGGVSTLGDGSVVLILDPDGLMRLAYGGSA